MRRTLFAPVLALGVIATAFYLAQQPSLAQSTNRPDARDPELAGTVKRLTNRSTTGLLRKRLRNGAVGPGEGFNDPTPMAPEGGNPGTTLGALRLNVFNSAANVWGLYLDSHVPINVKAQFNPLSPCSTSGGVLGSAGATEIYRDFDG